VNPAYPPRAMAVEHNEGARMALVRELVRRRRERVVVATLRRR
jgi:hypothetical protein